VVNRSLSSSLFFPWIFVYYMSPFDSPLQNWFLIMQEVFTLKGLKLKFGFNSLTFIWMKKKQLAMIAMIAMVLNGKHK
jgi:hypothetical protein